MTPTQSSGKVEATNASSSTVALPGSATAGNLLVLMVTLLDNGGTNTAISTPSGWSVAANPLGVLVAASGYQKVAIFYKETCGTGTNSVVISAGVGSYFDSTMTEWAITGTGNLDKATSNTGSGASVTGGNSGTTANTTNANCIVLACCGADGLDTPTIVSSFSSPASSGYTSLANNADDNTSIACDHSHKTVAATGGQIGSWTWTGSANGLSWAAAIAAFKIGGSAATFTAVNRRSTGARVGTRSAY